MHDRKPSLLLFFTALAALLVPRATVAQDRATLSGAGSPEGPPVSVQITEVLFEDMEGWPAPRVVLKAGEELVLTFRADGFERQQSVNPETGLPEYKVHLSYQLEMRDPNDVPVLPVYSDGLESVLSMQDEKWQPMFRWSAMIPKWAPSGTYSVLITLQDELGEARDVHAARFNVQGERVSSSNGLAVQQFEVARSEQGPWSPRRVFSVRDPVHVRYKVTGFHVGQDHRVWVEQDLSLLNEQGEVVITQENAATEMSQEFYPPRFIPTSLVLELEDPKPGEYRLVVTVRDRIGEQSTAAEGGFILRP